MRILISGVVCSNRAYSAHCSERRTLGGLSVLLCVGWVASCSGKSTLLLIFILKQMQSLTRPGADNFSSTLVQVVAGGKESKEPQVVVCEPPIYQLTASAEVEKSECANECVNESSIPIRLSIASNGLQHVHNLVRKYDCCARKSNGGSV